MTIPAHPKVLLIDIEASAVDALKERGFNARGGTYGLPYDVEAHSEPLRLNFHLPNFEEQEIVVVDLVPQRGRWTSRQIQTHGKALRDMTVPRGVADPAPAAMSAHEEEATRILQHGGVFVLFAGPEAHAEYRKHNLVRIDNWSLIGWGWMDLSRHSFDVTADTGDEISVIDAGPFGRLLSRHLDRARFDCAFRRLPREKHVTALAVSKYKQIVSFSLKTAKGYVLVFPQVHDKVAFLSELVAEVLPDLCPHLYARPDFAHAWLCTEEYELEPILVRRELIRQVEADAAAQVAALNQEIDQLRASDGFLHDLLTASGTSLVAAVKKALEVIGFTKVLDVDIEQNSDSELREDLQITDRSPTLLVEVKGLGGLPSDEAALQASKYVAPRMKEWGRTDVQALSIINHERHKPALDRNNNTPFRQVILDNARAQSFGVMTTWDLFKLVRNHTRNRWNPAVVLPLFYSVGRIEPIPVHYTLLGLIERFAANLSVVGISVTDRPFRKGARLAFELSTYFFEEEALSIELGGTPVDEAPQGSVVGMKTRLTSSLAKKGTRVFLVGALEP